jgi:hypothetical protein
MKTRTKFAAVSLAGLTLAVAGASFAHPGMGMGYGACAGPAAGASAAAGPCAGIGPGMGPGMGMGPGWTGRGPGAWDAAAVGTRLETLKAEIKITAAQESAWQAYAAVVKQHAEQRQALRTQMQAQMQDPQVAASVDRAAQREAMLKLRDQHWAERDAALKNLYAVLTPEQKTLADQRLAAGPGHRWAMRGQGR